MEQGTFWGKLFNAWLDFFTFLKLGAVQVYALGVLLVYLYNVGMSSLLWQINAYATLMTLSLNAFEMLFWSMQPHSFKPQYVNIPCTGINTLRTRQNGCHVAADILKCISMNENVWILNNMSLKCIPWDLIRNMSAFVQVMAWPLTGTTPLPEPMMTLVTDASGVLKKHFGQSRAHGYLVYNAVAYNGSRVVLYI